MHSASQSSINISLFSEGEIRSSYTDQFSTAVVLEMTTLIYRYAHPPGSTDEMSRPGQQCCSHSAGIAGTTEGSVLK